MKKMILALVLLPFLASAQNYSGSTEQQALDNSGPEIQLAWPRVRCNKKSDFNCQGHNVYESCLKDPNHGIYGTCRGDDSEVETACYCF